MPENDYFGDFGLPEDNYDFFGTGGYSPDVGATPGLGASGGSDRFADLSRLRDMFTTPPPSTGDIQQLSSIVGGRSFTGDMARPDMNTFINDLIQTEAAKRQGRFQGLSSGLQQGGPAIIDFINKLLGGTEGTTPASANLQTHSQDAQRQLQEALDRAMGTVGIDRAPIQAAMDAAIGRIGTNRTQIGDAIDRAIASVQAQSAGFPQKLLDFQASQGGAGQVGNIIKDILQKNATIAQDAGTAAKNRFAGLGRSPGSSILGRELSDIGERQQRGNVMGAAEIEKLLLPMLQNRESIYGNLLGQGMASEAGLEGNRTSALTGLSGQEAGLGGGFINALTNIGTAEQGARSGIQQQGIGALSGILQQVLRGEVDLATIPAQARAQIIQALLGNLLQ